MEFFTLDLIYLGVPAKHKTPDLLQFTAPCHSELEMMRFIQYQDVPNQYMVLLRFRCQGKIQKFKSTKYYYEFVFSTYNIFLNQIKLSSPSSYFIINLFYSDIIVNS